MIEKQKNNMEKECGADGIRNPQNHGKGLSRDAIKLLAILAMVLNHISTIFLEPGKVLSELLLDVGYLTAPVMCYFLVEGYAYTHSRKKYGLRLAVFAAISEFPFCLAFTEEGFLEFAGMNMIFTLFLCFLLLEARTKITDPFLRNAAQILLIAASAISDWGILAPVMTLLFAKAQEKNENAGKAFVWTAVLFGIVNYGEGIGRFSVGGCFLYALGTVIGIALAAFLILHCYNGRRVRRSRKFWGWFFYLFYPGHLLLLGAIRLFMAG